MNEISRRDFLKLGGAGLVGLLLPPLNFHLTDPFAALQGRVTTRTVWMYDQPTLSGAQVKLCQRDLLLNITNTALSDDLNANNRIWYEIGQPNLTEGYVYSGNIQPVRTVLNPTPTRDIPEEGLLTEVTVPYTDAHEQPDKNSKVGYRIYYETTHWIKSVATNEAGEVWYQIVDDKWDKLYFVKAEHLRVLTAADVAPISADVPNKNKKILVQLEKQLVTAFEYDAPVFVASASTGGIFRVGTYTTPQGSFITYYKRPSRHMAAGDLAASGFDLPGVPWVQYITKSGISFHGTYWHNDFGRPRSHGCINLSSASAKWLYRWSTPEVPLKKDFVYGGLGTKVEIIL
ncbi:MAG: L,D-transpeptidase [Anaerolineales bacterium]|nr:L,D-transpeptidase [Anaerolineales bacterium]